MEWQGIDLSHNHEQKWLKQSMKSLWLTISTIVVAAIIALFVVFKTQNLANTVHQINTEITHLNQHLKQLNQKIHLIKNQRVSVQSTYLEKPHIQQFIRYLEILSVKGFIEQLQLYLDNHVKLKIVGKLANENTFQAITEQLKQEKLTYKIDHFENNDQHQLEFSLIINLIEKNENVD